MSARRISPPPAPHLLAHRLLPDRLLAHCLLAPHLLAHRLLPDRLLADDPATAGWVLLAACAALPVWWLSGSPRLAAVTGLLCLILAWWRISVAFAALRDALQAARQQREAMEETLRQSQQMEAVGRLTVGIAHDFNNHLTVISSNLELVKRRLDVGQERLQRHADAAIQGVQRAATLTGRLLSFSRSPAPEPEPVDVRRLLSGLADLLRRTLHEGVDLVVEEPNETWCIWADANQMENALLSLAVNVRDQVVDGGVLIVSVTNVQLNSVCTEKKPLLLPGDYVCISVSPSPRAAALDASLWQQTDDLNSAGLAMARGFVHDAGGTLLRSDPAEPALSLRLLLPRFLPPTPAPGVDRRRAGVTRILVVEDDEAVRRACVEALSGLDYQILEAPDAMEAFRLIADHGGIDLLLTDLGLPGGVSGRALADAARNVDRGIRVVFTTGYERADSTAQLGGTLLRKPFSSAQLAEKVREALAPGKAGEPTETVQG